MPRIDIKNDYPVELTPPDISAYAAGNTGIPYVWRFESETPGPNAMVAAIVHGNEPCGAIALDWLLSSDVRPVSGSLTLAFMNIAAYEDFDPADPNATRWIDEDMNRVWDPAVLDGPRDSAELRRAREVRPALEDIDLLLDLHSMQHYAPPLMMSGRHARAKTLAAQVGLPDRVVGDFGHAAGRRMRDFCQFDEAQSAKTALLVECGQHWESEAAPLAKKVTARFLSASGVLPHSFATEHGGEDGEQTFFTVTTAVTIRSEDGFRFNENYTGGEVIADAGTIIGFDGDTPVATPDDDMMLVMPSKRLWQGQTAVRLAVRDPG